MTRCLSGFSNGEESQSVLCHYPLGRSGGSAHKGMREAEIQRTDIQISHISVKEWKQIKPFDFQTVLSRVLSLF
jgi:hypothetical protein